MTHSVGVSDFAKKYLEEQARILCVSETELATRCIVQALTDGVRNRVVTMRQKSLRRSGHTRKTDL